MNEPIHELLRELVNTPEIEVSDIPKLDLYMDQVITLFENTLEQTKRNADDKLLTKTMINNYTKDKILQPAQNKKYSPEHIIQMVLIYHLKQSLSIGDIKTLFQSTLHRDGVDLWQVYQDFLEHKEEQSIQIEKQMNEQIAALDRVDNEEERMLLTILALTHHANIYKRLAEKLLDQLKS